MRSEHIERGEMEHLLAALTPANRLAMELSLATGLRIDDCLALRTEKLAPRMTVRERKTGKTRRVFIPSALLARLRRQAGLVWAFDGRCDAKKHRTRQAVFKDLRRAAGLFRVAAHVSPHSARKIYAVEQYRASGGNLRHVQCLLQHSSEAVTMLYAMADQMATRRGSGRSGGASAPPTSAP